MGFGWLGTFRQGQWQAFRSFVLNERRDAGRRLAVIQAELTRIGQVSIGYARVTDPATGETVITEQRTSFGVSQGSNLEKLFQAYVSQGGNPFDVSLFLTPDSTFVTDESDLESEYQTQPYGGVIYPLTGSSALGMRYQGGYLVVKKYPPARTGGRKDLQDNTVVGAIDVARKWANPVIRQRLHNLEAKIIKQVDLREQLLNEIDAITMAVGGVAGDIPSLDLNFYDPRMGVAKTVAAIDSIFYQIKDGVPDFKSVNEEVLPSYPSLMTDIPDEEDNTAL